MFARAPGSNDAKSRLKRDLGGERGGAIYRWMVSRSLELRSPLSPGIDWFIFVDERTGLPWFQRHAFGWEVRVQAEGSLGNRLEQAFVTLFEAGYGSVVCVGSDIPELRTRHLMVASWLLQESPIVIGPCSDGGYYLIGQRAPGGRLFSGIQWGGPRVYRDTYQLAAEAGLEVAVLPILHDIDTGDDWQALLLRQAQSPAAQHRSGSKSVVTGPAGRAENANQLGG